MIGVFYSCLGSKSQNALWNAITAGIGIKDKDKRGIVIDPRSPEEILADELPSVDGPDAMEKTAIRSGHKEGSILHTRTFTVTHTLSLSLLCVLLRD